MCGSVIAWMLNCYAIIVANFYSSMSMWIWNLYLFYIGILNCLWELFASNLHKNLFFSLCCSSFLLIWFGPRHYDVKYVPGPIQTLCCSHAEPNTIIVPLTSCIQCINEAIFFLNFSHPEGATYLHTIIWVLCLQGKEWIGGMSHFVIVGPPRELESEYRK